MKRFAIVATLLAAAAAAYAQQAGTPPFPPLEVAPQLTGAGEPAKFKPEELEAIGATIASSSSGLNLAGSAARAGADGLHLSARDRRGGALVQGQPGTQGPGAPGCAPE